MARTLQTLVGSAIEKVGASEEAPTLSLGGKLPWASTDTPASEAAAAFEPRVRSTERPENISVASPEPSVSSFLEGAKPSKLCFSVHRISPHPILYYQLLTPPAPQKLWSLYPELRRAPSTSRQLPQNQPRVTCAKEEIFLNSDLIYITPLKTICGIYCTTQPCMNFQKFLNQKYVITILPKGKDTTY